VVSSNPAAAARFASSELAKVSDPAKAPQMQAYMKTDMPFFGVQKPGRSLILRRLVADYRPTTADGYGRLVRALWALPHREEKYLALGVAVRFDEFITPEQLDLYEALIAEGAWWDFVDEVATHLIRPLVIAHPDETWPVVDEWIGHENMWLRRTAILCQVGAKEATDRLRLFRYCEQLAHEREFFIRKAIGWALREYAKTEPDAVAGFLNHHRDELSGLSYREASKHIRHLVGPQ
jgi:3-methyladenine DNA glycosylase AlkD